MLRAVEMKNYLDKEPGELAGGQQRLSDSCDRTIELVDGFIVSDATNTGKIGGCAHEGEPVPR